jgi:hypothetical protein
MKTRAYSKVMDKVGLIPAKVLELKNGYKNGKSKRSRTVT